MSRRSLLLGTAGLGVSGSIRGAVAPVRAAPSVPLWKRARPNGILYGSSAATWELSDPEYDAVFNREAAILLTEDDLLWYRIKPTPDAPLDFTRPDRIIAHAQRQDMRVLGAHLVWDEGYGKGWPKKYLWRLSEADARDLLFGVEGAVVSRYCGQVDAWSVANEVTSPDGIDGLRTDVPWYATIGPSYVGDAFDVAHEADPHAMLLLNEFGFETVSQDGDQPEPRRRATLQVIDRLLSDGSPVHALGVQAHLSADHFADRFDANAYVRWLGEVADRGLAIFITELDVLDDGLPADPVTRDAGVAEVYMRYLDAVLAEKAVKSVINFGLSDRYTWLADDFPRDDGAARRPLAFDEDMARKPAFRAIARSLSHAPYRPPVWP